MYRHYDLENEIQNPLASASRFLKARTKGNLEVKPVTVTNLSTFQPFNHSTNYPSHLTLHASRKSAFTLAEVLITLGIIGVVAALVIPNLISNYEKKVIETGIAKTYSELSTWLQKAENDYGPFAYWNLSGGSFITIPRKYVYPYLQATRCSGQKQCGVEGGYWFKPAVNSAPADVYGELLHYERYFLPDGRVMAVGHEYYSDWATPGVGLTFYVDVNGKRGKTVMGQDVFVFSINNFRTGNTNRVVAGRTTGKLTTDYVRNNCIYAAGKYGMDCSILLERNNWKFPKDYPIKF